ncbi:Membrane-anchored ribosome-binding protein, inhibits growth in stationary phase, ElaB/YqjD/DUF883 family [Rhodovulum sp. ES.010]|uniref:DUF883 family protein n=1 Tax=Rhodovulum sp. ES.010 TaxID=1882821 RepID=UPI00092BD28C|nr:DUF883 family protein [Rhodovulum sp. ES.010]SIO13546.1 Membrane-anchored ribosome-binding protein, inhibits growth in stationary phase, ElaB/YqjD/DUF883 family [Rhodovulum sp. ES.010]
MAQSGNGAASSEDLARQIEALKDDVAGISKILTEMGGAQRDAALDRVQREAAEMRARGEAAATEARDRGVAAGNEALDAVRRQPATAVGLAVGLGFLVGLMTGRR